jgi:phosphoribosylglycinamide formyltransferase 1
VGERSEETLRLAVLLSGGGRTLSNLLREIDAGAVPAEVVAVVASRPGVRGLTIARDAGIASYAVDRKQHADSASFSAAITECILPHRPGLVVCAGFLSLYLPPPELRDRVMNIHPALIPAFCGHGFYGARVHRAAIEAGVRVSGCTVHFADQEYDHGPIILQRVVPVFENDTPDDLAERVFAEECIAYPEAIRLFAQGRLRIEGRRVRALPPLA